MNASGPLSNVAQALLELEATNGKVNISKVARNHHVSRTTLRDAWHSLLKFKNAPIPPINDLARRIAYHRADGRGRHSNRALTDDAEKHVHDDLMDQYPDGFVDFNLQSLAHLNQHELRSKPSILSRTYVKLFEHRWDVRDSHLSTRSRSKKDRNEEDEEGFLEACHYLEEFDRLSKIIHPSLIINVDECPVYVKQAGSRVKRFTHSHPPFKHVIASSRLKVTVIGSVTASGLMLKPTIIAKGKTVSCERRFKREVGGSAFVQRTESGVTTSISFIEFIESVIVPHTKNQPAVLIADAYPAHITSLVKRCCADHNLTLLVVPRRGTHTLQPVDVGIFGPTKAKTGKIYRNTMMSVDWIELNQWQAASLFVSAIRSMSHQAIMWSWQLVFWNFVDELKRRNMPYWFGDDPRYRMM
jgi:hypothetical protein